MPRTDRSELRNPWCYNSRLSRGKYLSLLQYFCEGLPASKAAKELSQQYGLITRQTVAKYYCYIGLKALRDEEIFKRFTWWTERGVHHLTYDQIQAIRKVVYVKDDLIREIEHKLKVKTGKPGAPGLATYIEILRDMSKRMKGISSETFEMHLGRACLLASFMDEKLPKHNIPLRPQSPSERMFHFLHYYFERNPELWPRKNIRNRTNMPDDRDVRVHPEDWGPVDTFRGGERLELSLPNDITVPWPTDKANKQSWSELYFLAAFDKSVRLPSPARLVQRAYGSPRPKSPRNRRSTKR